MSFILPNIQKNSLLISHNSSTLYLHDKLAAIRSCKMVARRTDEPNMADPFSLEAEKKFVVKKKKKDLIVVFKSKFYFLLKSEQSISYV